MERRYWTVLLVLLMGFGLLVERSDKDSVRDRMVRAVDDVKSYTFTNDITIKTGGVSDGIPVDYVQHIKSSGVTDIENRKMLMSIEILNFNQSEKMDVYFIGNYAYVVTEKGLTKQEIPLEDAWRTRTQIKQQSGLLKHADVELLREEVLDGNDVYVLGVKPDVEKLVRYMTEQSLVGLPTSDEEINKRVKMAKSIKVLQWVDKKTFLPIRFEMDVVMDTGDLRRETNIVMTVKNYNEPLTIDLPEFPSDECRIREPDPKGYLSKICKYLKENEDWIIPNKNPEEYSIEEIEEGQYQGRDVFVIRLDCCHTGDLAYIDRETEEVIGFSPGDI